MTEINDPHCERCGEKLNPKTMVELELDMRTSQYGLPGSVPAQHSQGLFYFGRACAKHVLANNGYVFTIGKRAPANRPKRKRG